MTGLFNNELLLLTVTMNVCINQKFLVKYHDIESFKTMGPLKSELLAVS